jgi:hypothetical protein
MSLVAENLPPIKKYYQKSFNRIGGRKIQPIDEASDENNVFLENNYGIEAPGHGKCRVISSGHVD